MTEDRKYRSEHRIVKNSNYWTRRRSWRWGVCQPGGQVFQPDPHAKLTMQNSGGPGGVGPQLNAETKIRLTLAESAAYKNLKTL